MSQKQTVKRERRNFFVYVVESPSSDDLYNRRFEGWALVQVLNLAGIPSDYKLAVDIEAFKYSLAEGFLECLKRMGVLPPILHISSHGSSEGIMLTKGDVLGWNELRDLIMPINQAYKGNLVFCISSCEGFSACRMAMKEGELPFLGIVGNIGMAKLSDTTIAFSTFYHLIAKGYMITDAVKAMRKASGDEKFKEIRGIVAQKAYIEEVRKLQLKAITESLSEYISKKS